MECFVTKLKAVVNDDSLTTLGGIKFSLSEVGTFNGALSPTLNNTLTFKVIKGKVSLKKYDTGADIPIPAELPYGTAWISIIVEEPSVIEIGNKYEAMDLSPVFAACSAKDVAELDYMPELVSMNANRKATIERGIVGDCAELLQFSKLEYIYWNNAMCYGDISTLGKLANLKRLEILSSFCTGSLEQFVLYARSVGRTSGKISFGWFNDAGVTFNGGVCATKSGTILEWTPTTITWNGVTITA